MNIRTIIMVAFFTAFMYVLGFIPRIQLLPFPMPIVLQNIGVFLAGSILGLVGIISILLFLFLVLIGFPLLPGGRGGLIVFAGPTGGFLIGYLLAAIIIGILVYHFWSRINFLKFFLFNCIGLVFMYIPGILWLAFTTEIDIMKAFITCLIFIPGDIIKILIACYIALQIKKYYPLIEKTDINDSTYKHSQRQLSLNK